MKRIIFATRVSVFSFSTCLLLASAVTAQPFPLTSEEIRFQTEIDNLQQRQRWQPQRLDTQRQQLLRIECQQRRQWLQTQHLPPQFVQAQRQLLELKCQPSQLPYQFPQLELEAGTTPIQVDKNSSLSPLNFSCAQGDEGSCEQLR